MLFYASFILIKEHSLAEFFEIYPYVFLVLGAISFGFDYVREKIKDNSRNIKIYRLVFLFFIILVIASPFVLYRKYMPDLINIVKNVNYYFKKNDIKLDGQRLSENIIISIEYPEKDNILSGIKRISGWAIESNSADDSGIDRVDIFIDGKPGIGQYLDPLYVKIIKEDSPAYKLVSRLYKECYGYIYEKNIVNSWVTKLESGKVSVDDIIKELILNEKFENRNLSDNEYINVLYKVLLNRQADNIGFRHWLDELKEGTSRENILYEFLDSPEYKTLRGTYNREISEYLEFVNTGINLPKNNVAGNYGEQFKMSGFNFLFDCTGFKNGKHTFYIFAHSSIFGWDYIMIDVNIKN
ncbi:MAG: DUF4214 domain-containing protein [Actinomycetota bacterium]